MHHYARPVPFSQRLIDWQQHYGRHDLPWQVNDPYRVCLSEIMLQQTQVKTVIPYYQKFIAAFPTLDALAASSLENVLSLWSGLGYYSRARNLHKAAQIVMQNFKGQFPSQVEEIVTLPGIGRSTAAAIAAFCFQAREPILDGNVKRILSRWAGIEGLPGEKSVENRLWQLAKTLLPKKNTDMPSYTQAQMDLGASICTRQKPACLICPLSQDCFAKQHALQNAFPTPRKRQALPTRYTVMLLIRDAQHRWLLEKRPPSGIWGGLWSLPECNSCEEAGTFCRQQFGLIVEAKPALAPLTHAFTHFRLVITPLPLSVLHADCPASHPACDWFSPNTIATLGIPAVLRKILHTVSDAALSVL